MLHKSRERPFDSASDFVPERGGARNEPELKRLNNRAARRLSRWHSHFGVAIRNSTHHHRFGRSAFNVELFGAQAVPGIIEMIS